MIIVTPKRWFDFIRMLIKNYTNRSVFLASTVNSNSTVNQYNWNTLLVKLKKKTLKMW